MAPFTSPPARVSRTRKRAPIASQNLDTSDDATASPPSRSRRRRTLGLNEPTAISARNVLADPDLARLAPSLVIEMVDLFGLKASKRRLRTFTPQQDAMLEGSIRRFGFNIPILITRSREIVAGERRAVAAKAVGLTQAPAIFIDHLSEAEVEAFRIADNKLAQAGKWDEKVVGEALKALAAFDIDCFDMGFEVFEVDRLLTLDEQPEDLDDTRLSSGDRYRVIEGDVFALGKHRVMCGNALVRDDLATLMGGDEAAMAFLDAPYNVPIAGHVTKDRDCDEFAMGVGEMCPAEFVDFLASTHEQVRDICLEGALIFSCMDHRGIGRLLAAAERVELDYLNLAVWAKNKAGMGSLYRSQHELIAVFRKRGAHHRNNVMLGKNGRNRTNLWEYRTPVLNASSVDDAVKEHPTPKPWDMIADAMKDCTRRDDIVVDVFGGSGATLVAAEKTSRQARILELSPHHVANMLARFERHFGVEGTHAETGLTARALTEQRSGA